MRAGARPARGMARPVRAGLLGLALAGLGACVAPPDGRDAEAGAMAFRDNCAGCHGAAGAGGVRPDAPALDRLAAENGGVFPAQYVLGVIEGHGRNPAFSAAMPEFAGAGMGAGPVVDVAGVDRPVSARTAGVLAYLASIQK